MFPKGAPRFGCQLLNSSGWYYHSDHLRACHARRKATIAVPEELLVEVDRAARERAESCSAFITRILRAAVRARRDPEVTRRLDALFADERLRETQRREAEESAEAAVNWNERW